MIEAIDAENAFSKDRALFESLSNVKKKYYLLSICTGINLLLLMVRNILSSKSSVFNTRGESKYDLLSCCSPKTGHRGREQMSGDYRQKASYRLPRKLL